MSKEVLNGDDEEAKQTTRSVLAYVLDQTLRLLHPIMPFVTEEIWQHVPHEGDSLVQAAYPEVDDALNHPEAVDHMEVLISFIRAIRNARNEQNVPLSKPINILVKANDEETQAILEDNLSYIERFCHPESIEITTTMEAPDQALTTFFNRGEIYLPLKGFINIDDEIKRLEDELAKWQSEVDRVEKKLANEKFVANAPEKVVQGERDKGADYKQKLASTEQRLQELKQL